MSSLSEQADSLVAELLELIPALTPWRGHFTTMDWEARTTARYPDQWMASFDELLEGLDPTDLRDALEHRSES
jgi:hypothetical protein